MNQSPIHILGIAGSLRKESFNRKIIRNVADQAAPEMECSIFDLQSIPLFNGDLEAGGDPAEVAEFKEAIRRADGLYIVTPEYSHGIPGVLKNALDWAGSMTNENALDGKPAFVIGASPSILGTAFAQVQVKQTLAAAGAIVLQQPEVYIGQVPKKLNDHGRLTDERTIRAVDKSLAAFSDWIKLHGNNR
ncbi:NADPH-dependent FMN reductase [Alteribacillus sp. HJP-4]|uniref:NADPH-dependent FMN reductase n=1 Tax=Alteribacillus sp. HJP-4 TaxID=2775394 RepID=UPI0035CCD3DD